MEQKIETGGPAFPCHADIIPSKDRDYAGMTLRDYFAAAALTGIIAKGEDEMYPGFRASEAYATKDCFYSPCHKNYRKDGCSVYFVKRDGKATASWPYDSEGTPV